MRYVRIRPHIRTLYRSVYASSVDWETSWDEPRRSVRYTEHQSRVFSTRRKVGAIAREPVDDVAAVLRREITEYIIHTWNSPVRAEGAAGSPVRHRDVL
jgi:hypothetical protein